MFLRVASGLALLLATASCAGDTTGTASLPWQNGEVVQRIDLTGDGKQELVVDPHDGATAHTIAIASLEGRATKHIRSPEGDELRLLRYQNSMCCLHEMVGVKCVESAVDGRLELLEFKVNDETADWEYTTYRIDKDRAQVVARGRSVDGASFPGGLPTAGGYQCRATTY